MRASWTKLETGDWGVKLVDSPWPGDSGYGMPVTITAASGKKSDVVLSDLVKSFRIKGGIIVKIHKIATEDERKKMIDDYTAARVAALR
jgi:hypothetical protein